MRGEEIKKGWGAHPVNKDAAVAVRYILEAEAPQKWEWLYVERRTRGDDGLACCTERTKALFFFFCCTARAILEDIGCEGKMNKDFLLARLQSERTWWFLAHQKCWGFVIYCQKCSSLERRSSSSFNFRGREMLTVAVQTWYFMYVRFILC